MSLSCQCNNGSPAITEIYTNGSKSFLARHCCSHCEYYLFDIELKLGMQIIATESIASCDGEYVVPKGRLLRITAFSEASSSCIGLVFAGLLAAGAFHPKGFAAQWDITRILINEETD